MLQICEREDPAYIVLHQNATFTGQAESDQVEGRAVLRDGFPGGRTGADKAARPGAHDSWQHAGRRSKRSCRCATSRSPSTASPPCAASISTWRAGEAVGLVGESGCGKSVTWLAALGLLPRDRSRRRQRAARRSGTGRRARAGAGARARAADRDDLPGPGERAEPGASRRAAGGRGAAAASRHGRRGGAGRGAAAVRAGRHPRSRAAAGRLSARDVGRPEPARDDRDGAGRAARAAGRGRADHGARRHHPGADPRTAAPAAGANSAWRWC